VLGPFLSDEDGKTARTDLTIANTDIILHKTGASTFVVKSAEAATHLAKGLYLVVLNTTDTNTAGPLDIYVHVTGALPIKKECTVLPQAVYDAKYAGAYQAVNVVQIEGSDASDQIRDAVVDDQTRIDASALNTASGRIQGDITPTILGRIDAAVSSRLAAEAYTAPDNSGIAAIKTSTDKLGTAMEADDSVYRFTANALEQAPTGGGGGGPTAVEIRQEMDANSTKLADIKAKTDALSTDADIAAAVWDEALAGHSTAGSAGAGLAAAGSAGDPWSTPLPGSYEAGTAGKLIGDNINAPIATVEGVVDAIKAKTDNLPANPAAVGSAMTLENGAVTANAIASGAITAAKIATGAFTAAKFAAGAINAAAVATDTLAAIADKLLGRNIAGGSDGGRTVTQALRALRNRVRFLAGIMSVFREDDTTVDYTAAVTTDENGVVTEIDPS
jgi:hypothetical protein